MSTVAAEREPSLLADFKVIGVIGFAHFVSHYYIFLLPPLFPILKDAFGVSYTELGWIFTGFNLATLATQAPIGFLVDRVGARAVLIIGILVQSAAFIAIGLSGTYLSMLIFMIVAGCANGVYHPADYSILSQAVSEKRIGRAFSLHTFSGFCGNAIAPTVIITAAVTIGWQGGFIASGLAGIVVAGIVAFMGRTVGQDGGAAKKAAKKDKKDGQGGDARVLFSPPILICLAFFTLLALGSIGINHFLVASLNELYGVPVEEAAVALTGYLVGSTVGILIGGVIADRTRHHNRVAALCFLVTASMILLIGTTPMPVAVLVVLLSATGMMHGLIMPSRDMIVRSVTPEGSFGKVFGFVTSGFSIGGLIAPPAYGYILDNYSPEYVFITVSAIMVVSMATVFTSGRRPAS
jgi:FSR family fosmidomycin resistance protein-like MFS transporter